MLKERFDLVASNTRELFEHFRDLVIVSQVIEERSHWYPRAIEAGSAAHDFGINFDRAVHGHFFPNPYNLSPVLT